MNSTLYEILGVAKEATEQDIRRAYRRKAQKMHPDKEGGDPALFRLVQLAYDVLCDPVRRKLYDETGATSQNDDNAKMLQELAQLFFYVIDKTGDVTTDNVIKLTEDFLAAGLEKAGEEMQEVDEKIEKLEEVIKRITAKGTEAALVDMLRAQISDLKKKIEHTETKLAGVAKMQDILKEYSYKTDKPKMQMRGASPYVWNGPP